MPSLLLPFAFPPPPSLLVNAMSAVAVPSLACLGISEAAGRHLQYSKITDAGASPSKLPGLGGRARVSSRAGILVLYAPALTAALAAFGFPGVVEAPRGALVASALALHFFKRVLEVLLVHQYSGDMTLDSVIAISFSHFMYTVLTVYAQYLTEGTSEPRIDLKYQGMILFLSRNHRQLLPPCPTFKAQEEG